uniref:Uncharacterized protein n=1 Tax=Torque teno virus TaxID=68887 RepID=A0A7L8Y9W2_9VIRU|nr:hypothetical protein [Torque teno virus]
MGRRVRDGLRMGQARPFLLHGHPLLPRGSQGAPSILCNFQTRLEIKIQGLSLFTCRCLPLKVTKHSERQRGVRPFSLHTPLPWCNALGGRALRLRLRAAPRTPARADTLARVRPLRARGGREIC